jgi:hypothetical protein
VAKKKEIVKVKSTMDMTFDEVRAKGGFVYSNMNMDFYGTATRTYEIGERVTLGARTNVIVVHDFGDNTYIIEMDVGVNRVGSTPSGARERVHVRWFDIHKVNTNNKKEFYQEWKRPSYLNSGLSSLVHLHTFEGLVIDDRFQRGYVWTDADRESLLDSIFDRGNIGTFLLCRNHGYHKKNQPDITYRTITGENVTIKAEEDYTVSIIDGQQRLTTLMNFWMGRFKYRGRTFEELSGWDKYAFEDFPIQYALVNDNEYTYEELLRLFIQTNRGVPVDQTHMEKVVALYNSLQKD